MTTQHSWRLKSGAVFFIEQYYREYWKMLCPKILIRKIWRIMYCLLIDEWHPSHLRHTNILLSIGYNNTCIKTKVSVLYLSSIHGIHGAAFAVHKYGWSKFKNCQCKTAGLHYILTECPHLTLPNIAPLLFGNRQYLADEEISGGRFFLDARFTRWDP